MATLTVNEIGRTGFNLTTGDVAAAGGGDEFVNTGREALYVDNAGDSACVITLDIEQTVDGQAVTDPTVSVPANSIMAIGPFQTAIYNNSTTGRVSFTYDQVVTVTVAVLQLTAV